MALDGTVISCMAWELNHALAGGKINKIAQPEKDDLTPDCSGTRTKPTPVRSGIRKLDLIDVAVISTRQKADIPARIYLLFFIMIVFPVL